MATITELTLEGLEIKNDILKAESIEIMRTVFSTDLFSYLRSKGLYSLAQCKNYSVSFSRTTFGSIKDLKGMQYLGEASKFDGVNQDFLNVDFSGLKDTSILNAYTSGISGKIYFNPDNEIEYFNLFNNDITDVFGLENIATNIKDIKLNINSLSVNSVDSVLKQVRNSVENNGITIRLLNLQDNSVPTGGDTNSDYLYLIGEGITVTIDTV